MRKIGSLFAFAALSFSPVVSAADFIDLAVVDRAVAEFTGAAIGLPGGARSPVDRRLKLRACSAPLAVSWHGRGQVSVAVQCPVAGGWRVFVPVAAQASGSDGQAAPLTPVSSTPHSNASLNSRTAASGPMVVARGETVTVAVTGSGFTLTRQAQAMEPGAVGDWIRVKPQGNKAEPLRAQVLDAGLVGMKLP